jgi:hypothetical protein
MRHRLSLAAALSIFFSALLATVFSGNAAASSSDPTIYSIICASSGRVNVYLEYGVSSITITNPNGCSGSPRFYLSNGRSSTWTYSQTSSGTTTSGSYNPEGINLQSAAIGAADSFTLTLTSTNSSSVTFSGGGVTLDIYFNKQIETISPSPVSIGQQVTVSGSNLSSVTNMFFSDGTNFFSVATENRTSSQLTFTVPATYVDFMSSQIINVVPGTYRSSSNPGKTITVTAASVVVSIDSAAVARQAALVAEAKRLAEKKIAQKEIFDCISDSVPITFNSFNSAEIYGVTKKNYNYVIQDINVKIIDESATALIKKQETTIFIVEQVVRKYVVLDSICEGLKLSGYHANDLLASGIIPNQSPVLITYKLRKYAVSQIDSYEKIVAVIKAETALIEQREKRLLKVLQWKSTVSFE